MVMKSALPKPKIVTVPAGEFKARCLQLIDDVESGSKIVVITKRGKVMAKLVATAAEEETFHSVLGRTPGVKVLGDIVSPLPEEFTLPDLSRAFPK